MDHTAHAPTVLSICSGVRGLERGLERAIGPVRTLCYVEIEACIIENLVCEMEAGEVASAPIWTDLTTFSGEIFRGSVDWILGGYPCTPFSLAGLRKGVEDARHLWPHVHRVVAAVRPIFCLFENVDDHLTLGFDQVYRDLRDLGYRVEAGVFSAEEAGAPHERQRLFILAVDDTYIGKQGSAGRLAGEDRGDTQGERGAEHGALVSGGAGAAGASQVDDTRGYGLGPEHAVSARGYGFEPAGKEKLEDSRGKRGGGRRVKRIDWGREVQVKGSGELADPAGAGGAGIAGGLLGADAQEFQPEEQLKDSARVVDTASVAIACRPGLAQWRRGYAWMGNRWPARPGERQWEWEHPRTLTRQAESVVGMSVDGYNFREDFLRALGNMVVPACAEIAVRELLKKHFGV